MKHYSCLLTTPHVKAMTKALIDAGLEVKSDPEAGTVTASHAEAGVVYRALQKGRGGRWIVRHVENLFV